MNITETTVVFNTAAMLTAVGSICLKKRGKALKELLDDDYGHGILVTPVIRQGEVRNPNEFSRMLSERSGSRPVTVRGHGWTGERRFVWTGTLDEFNDTWEVD